MCKKKKFSKKGAIGYLKSLKNGGYGKRPWRNEIAYYQCEICRSFHVSSLIGKTGAVVLKETSYFEHQKSKWRDFLQNRSSKKGKL